MAAGQQSAGFWQVVCCLAISNLTVSSFNRRAVPLVPERSKLHYFFQKKQQKTFLIPEFFRKCVYTIGNFDARGFLGIKRRERVSKAV